MEPWATGTDILCNENYFCKFKYKNNIAQHFIYKTKIE